MKVLKTVFVIALCAMFLFVFAACSQQQPAETEAPEEITDTVEQTENGDQVEIIDTETENTETATETQAPDAEQTEDAQDEPIGGQNVPVTQH